MTGVSGPVRRIGRYTVEQVIGTGAFATVYRATDERLDATVAIKLLADNHCLDPDIRARFIDEGRALRRVDSPHVLRVYDIGETEQLQPYLVIEHADRGTLAQRVARLQESGWRPSVVDIQVMVADLTAAVDAVHAANLVHRDLSPGNVLLRSVRAPGAGRPSAALVTPEERLVVADLGLAKDLARSSGLTVAGGTEGFRPPEQRRHPARVDGRADLWALSAVLFWLLTGQAPGTDDETASRHQLEDRLGRSLAELGLPADLRAPLLTSLADDPSQRHPDVHAWRADVDATLAPPVPSTGPSGALSSLASETTLAATPPGTPPGQTPGIPAAPMGAPGPDSGAGVPGRFADIAGSGSMSSPMSALPASMRRWRVLALAALLLLAAVAGATLAVWWPSSGDGGGTTTRRLDGGRVEVTDTAGDASLTIVGPARATVGDTVTLEAEAEGVDQWAWLMPDGTVYADEPTTQVRPRSAGTAEVVLVGTAESGERLEVVHALQVDDG